MPAAPNRPTDASPVSVTAGLLDTVLPDELASVVAGLEEAGRQPEGARRAAVAAVVRHHPRSLAGWAALGGLAGDDVEAYAYFRVGYHRGLDALRASGWRGSGTVRWVHPSNRGFLRCVEGLGATASIIGEHDEAERCALFLRQLDPSREAVPVDVAGHAGHADPTGEAGHAGDGA